ncbi:EVE domain-containing protein [Rhodotorula diobovata]|uniref:EVE domain-containing protein n=1 Tax=Rhodotorula diobovata TaxID=5288 RepID=A0A5C5FKU2_9BASI|nr:EVE domain-containing protein [Rhodotorula diobovata]
MVESRQITHWLVKAQPETRIEKGVNVRFSIDDLERNKTTTWEGVRNHEAKKLLKNEMKRGHECLFYASNCKVPGVTGLARVSKEGYPDFNAWDPKHPYYDPKSKESNPTWFMVDVEFVAKLEHLVPLSLLQALATLASSSPSPSSASSSPDPALPTSLSYLTPIHLRAIASSALIRRGRLSVQPVEDDFFEAVKLLGEQGGWEDWESAKEKKGRKAAAAKAGKGKAKADDEEGEGEKEDKPATKPSKARTGSRAKGEGQAKKAPEMEEGAAGGASDDEVTTGGKRGAKTAGTRSSKRLRGGS